MLYFFSKRNGQLQNEFEQINKIYNDEPFIRWLVKEIREKLSFSQ